MRKLCLGSFQNTKCPSVETTSVLITMLSVSSHHNYININYYSYLYYYYTNCLSTSPIVTPNCCTTIIVGYWRYVMFTSNWKFCKNVFLSRRELSDLLLKIKNATKVACLKNVLKINDFGKPDKAYKFHMLKNVKKTLFGPSVIRYDVINYSENRNFL